MSYRIKKSKLTPKDRDRALRIIKRGLDSGRTSTNIIKRLKDSQVSYSRSNMLHDIRRKESSFTAKTSEARNKAVKWFDNVYEPFRAKNKYGSKTASRKWQNTVSQTFDTIEDARQGVELWDLFKEFSP